MRSSGRFTVQCLEGSRYNKENVMRLKSLKNITNRRVRIKFASGMSANLLPGCTIENVTITNNEEIKGKVFAVQDLTEVSEETGRTRLDS